MSVDNDIGQLQAAVVALNRRLDSYSQDLSATDKLANETHDEVKWLRHQLGSDLANLGPIYSRLARVEEECHENSRLRQSFVLGCTLIGAIVTALGTLAALAPEVALRLLFP